MAQASETKGKFNDFNHKNIALITSVFVVLVGFLAVQGNLFGSVTKLGFTLGKFHSVFATNAPGSQVADSGQSAVLGASTLSPDIESQLSALPIQFAYQDTTSAAGIYAQQVRTVESADTSYTRLSQDLLAIAVPPTLAHYQRLIVLRAQLTAQLQIASSDQKTLLQANVDAISGEIQQQQSAFAAQGVTLPS